MALVSSLSPSAHSSFDLSAATYSNSSPEPPQLRPLPTASSSSNSSGRRTTSSSNVGGAVSYSSVGGGRPSPLQYPSRSPSAPPFLEARSSSSPASARPTLATSSSSLSNPPSSSRISHTPSPGVPTHSHSYSQSSSSGPPRLPPIQFSPGSNPPPTSAYSPQGQLPHSHFQPQQFPSLVYLNNTHAYPHPQYPFIPSPHPHAYQGSGPFSPGFPAGNDVHQQHQAMLLQQAHLQQQQWQMEMMRNQAAAAAGQPAGQFEWNGQQHQGPNSSSRRRATSGPAPASQSPQFYTTPLSYPSSPNPSHPQQYQRGVPPNPSFPSGAMLPKSGHGYPTPPGSVEGRDAGPGVAQGYHPYRRGGTPVGEGPRGAHPGRSQSSSATVAPAMSAQQSHASSSSMSSFPSSSSSANSNSTAATSQAPSETNGSLSMQNFPPLPKSTASPSPAIHVDAAQRTGAKSSSSSVSSASARAPSRSSSTPPPPPPFARSRTDSENSARSATGSFRPGSTTSSRSDEAPRASTPVQAATASAVVAGKKPSPLSQQLGSRAGTPTSDRPGTPRTAKGRTSMADDDEDSDDTASAMTAQQQVDTPKGKKGMAHKFKKAFGGSSKTIAASPSANGSIALTATELEGKGAREAGKARGKRDSSSSIESSSPRTPPNLHDSLPSIASGSASSSKPPPTGRRLGIFNSRLNSSTDNISISSTVSSASMMIRKLGQMGKLARRNSLMSLTKAFKSNKDEDGDKVNKKDKKKGLAATANVSHVTAELEGSTHTDGISPAAALAKKHQLQYAEQEAAAAAAAALVPPKSFAVHARTDSNASDASVKSARGGWGRSKSTDDVVEGGTREKEKSRKGRKWGFGSKNDDSSSVADENPIARAEQDAFNDQTPRQSLELLAAPATSGAAHPSNGGSYFDDGASRESAANVDDEYESSLRGAPPVPRRDAKAVRGILKGAGTYNQENYSLTRPAFPRDRASSFHAQNQQAQPSSPGQIPSEAQVDGRTSSSTSLVADIPTSPGTMTFPKSPYAYPTLNASAPVLKSTVPIHPIRSASTPGGNGRRIVFAQNLSVHTTWPAAVYDRRAEPATCNRLTPTLAQRIKEELNAFKMEEMEVHPTSRQLTHFFV